MNFMRVKFNYLYLTLDEVLCIYVYKQVKVYVNLKCSVYIVKHVNVKKKKKDNLLLQNRCSNKLLPQNPL